ncbi:Ceramidase [Botrimarina colliarenosi]|uniref:Ceramidase n=1 Tax=Botrimarina colliarenosi TaxID=2528001 RepID=A0A5C6AEL3_9BACT|nr:ceramidase domain-containing protein [Botrimarina colliarenosi]TWT98049.1 Ceramidase [Botrimarina colliarenosi]
MVRLDAYEPPTANSDAVTPNARYCFLIPLAAAVICVATLMALGAAGWPGETQDSTDRFCEATHPGPIAQPANTWSNVGFLLVGLGVGWQASRDVAARKATTWSNKLVTTVAYPATMAVCSILIGIGSTALHASTTNWGAELDLFSMHLWGAWMIAFATVRLLRLGDREFFSLWGTQALAIGTRLAFGEPYLIQGSTLFGAIVAAAVVIEVAGRWRNRYRQQLDTRYLVWAVVVFLAAYACFLTSTSKGPWCDPDSIWQGHAVWHLLCAGSTAFTYLYVRSERRLVSDAIA